MLGSHGNHDTGTQIHSGCLERILTSEVRKPFYHLKQFQTLKQPFDFNVRSKHLSDQVGACHLQIIVIRSCVCLSWVYCRGIYIKLWWRLWRKAIINRNNYLILSTSSAYPSRLNFQAMLHLFFRQMLFEQEDSNLYVEPVIFAKTAVEHFKVRSTLLYAVDFYVR